MFRRLPCACTKAFREIWNHISLVHSNAVLLMDLQVPIFMCLVGLPLACKIANMFLFTGVNIYLSQCMRFPTISNNVVCATSKASDHPAHMGSLIRAFASRLSFL